MKRFSSLVFFLFFISISVVNGQTHSQYIPVDTAAINRCNHVSLLENYTIYVDGYKLVYLKFDRQNPVFAVDYPIKGQPTYLSTQLSSTEYLLRINDETVEYVIRVFDDCGSQMDLLTIRNTVDELDLSTQEQVDGFKRDVTFTVPAKLRKPLRDFHGSGTAFGPFVAGVTGVNPILKAAVFQAHVLRFKRYQAIAAGSVLYNQVITAYETGNEDNLPEILFGYSSQFRPQAPTYSCKCSKFLVDPQHYPYNATEYGAQSHYQYVGYNDIEFSNGAMQGEKQPLLNDGWTAQRGKEKGASKWHALYTGGWKEQRNAYEESTVQRDSANRGELVLHLICTDASDFSDACGCNKKVTFHYEYCVTAETKAINSQGFGGDKKAIAQAQDMALVYCYESDEKGTLESSIQPIRAMDTRASAQCENTVNPNFWQNFRNLGNALLGLITNDDNEIFVWDYTYSYDSTLVQIDTLQDLGNNMYLLDSIYSIDTMVVDSNRVVQVNSNSDGFVNVHNSIWDILTTNYYLPTECSESSHKKCLFGKFITELKPNTELTLGLLTNYKLKSGGMRSWYSHAQVVSNYTIGAVIQRGLDEGPEYECCTPWAGVYLVGGGLYGNDVGWRRNIGGKLYVSGGFGNKYPNGLGGSALNKTVWGDQGYMTTHVNCPVWVNPRSAASKDLLEILPSEGTVRVYSIDGRLLKTFYKEFDTYPMRAQHLRTELSEKLVHLNSGPYIINISNGDFSKSIKFIK